MNAIPETVFTNKNTFLRIWFNDGVSGEAMIENGQRLTSVPYAYYAHNGVPPGAIIMWSGSIAEIPDGWALCDGTNGTPDLSGKFIYGRIDDVQPYSGGSATHTHICVSSGTHTHYYSGTTSNCSDNVHKEYGNHWVANANHSHTYSGYTNSAGSHSHTINSAFSLPPYYKLAFIMKLP
mgnify:CR=1 FL=1